jgi:hypothetical protein
MNPQRSPKQKGLGLDSRVTFVSPSAFLRMTRFHLDALQFAIFRIRKVGIELGRASCRWGVTVLALSIARRVHIPTMTTFAEAPLQSRKVEFLDSGFRLGFPREAFPRRAKLKHSLAFTPTHSGLPLDSSLKNMAPPAFAVDHSRTAKCSELLCQARALFAPGWCPAPPRRALPPLLRSYELMRQTSSLPRTS